MSPLALKQKQRRARKQRVPLSLKLDCVRGTSPQLPIFFQETRPQAEGASPAAALPARRTPPRPWPGRSTCGTSYLSLHRRGGGTSGVDVAAFRMRRVTLSRRMERRAGRLAHCGAAPLMRNGLDSHAAVLGAHAGGAAAADASLTP